MAIKMHRKGHRDARVFLAEWLKFKEMTAEQLAAAMDISKGTVSKLINGHQRYTLPLLQQIAYVLDCEVAQLLRPPRVPTRDELVQNASVDELRRALELIKAAKNPDIS